MYINKGYELYEFQQYLRNKYDISETTLVVYMRAVTEFLIENENYYDLDTYNHFLIKHAIKKRSSYYLYALKYYIKFKIEEKGLRNTILENLIRPEIRTTVKNERKYLNETEILDVINCMKKPKNKIISLIQFLTGIRAGDVLRIKRGDIIPEIYEEHLVLKLIITGKGKKRNIVYIHDETIQEIIIEFLVKNFLDEEYYFLEDKSRAKEPVSKKNNIHHANYTSYKRDLKQALYLQGYDTFDFSTHDYRRCYARRVWTKYKDLNILQELLNHVNPMTTMRYLKQSGLKNIDYHREMQIM